MDNLTREKQNLRRSVRGRKIIGLFKRIRDWGGGEREREKRGGGERKKAVRAEGRFLMKILKVSSPEDHLSI